MLKPLEAIELIKEISNDPQTEIWSHGLKFYPEQSFNMERPEGWYYTVSYASVEPGAVSQEAWFSYDETIANILNATYSEDDRIDDIFVEDGDLFVSVNMGNVGSGTIQDRFSLGKSVQSAAKN